MYSAWKYILFISFCWGGRVSDIDIVKGSNLSPNLHLPGDQVLADRGSTLKDDFAAMCGTELLLPAFTKGKPQLSAQEVEISRTLSMVRIHIERVIGLMKNRYTILQGPIPLYSLLISRINYDIDLKPSENINYIKSQNCFRWCVAWSHSAPFCNRSV